MCSGASNYKKRKGGEGDVDVDVDCNMRPDDIIDKMDHL